MVVVGVGRWGKFFWSINLINYTSLTVSTLFVFFLYVQSTHWDEFNWLRIPKTMKPKLLPYDVTWTKANISKFESGKQTTWHSNLNWRFRKNICFILHTARQMQVEYRNLFKEILLFLSSKSVNIWCNETHIAFIKSLAFTTFMKRHNWYIELYFTSIE